MVAEIERTKPIDIRRGLGVRSRHYEYLEKSARRIAGIGPYNIHHTNLSVGRGGVCSPCRAAV